MERGNLMHDVKRKPYKCKPRRGKISMHVSRGGSSRSSDEVSVMGIERRGCANPMKSRSIGNERNLDNLCSYRIERAIVMVGRSRMNREVHVRSL